MPKSVEQHHFEAGMHLSQTEGEEYPIFDAMTLAQFSIGFERLRGLSSEDNETDSQVNVALTSSGRTRRKRGAGVAGRRSSTEHTTTDRRGYAYEQAVIDYGLVHGLGSHAVDSDVHGGRNA